MRSLSRSGLDDLAKHRAALPSTELRALASGHGEELGRLGLAARIGNQSATRVLEWMERTRAAALSVVDAEPTTDISDDLGELRAVYAELVATRQETGAEPAGLRARQTRIEQRIRSATWSTHAQGAHAGAFSSAAELRRALDGRVLVEFDVLDGDSWRRYSSHVSPVSSASEGSRMCREDAESLLFFLRYVTSTRVPDMAVNASVANARATMDRLARNLIHPLGLAPDAELVIVSVSGLHALPWAALHTGPVALAPSGSMWARSRQTQALPTSRVVSAAGPETARCTTGDRASRSAS